MAPTYIFERGREAVGIRPLEKGQGADTRCVFNYFFVLNDIGPAESPSPLCISRRPSPWRKGTCPCLLSTRGLAHTHNTRAEGPGTRTKRGGGGCVCRTGRCTVALRRSVPRPTGVRSHAAELVPPAIFSLVCRHQLAQWSTWCSSQDLAVACEATGLSPGPGWLRLGCAAGAGHGFPPPALARGLLWGVGRPGPCSSGVFQGFVLPLGPLGSGLLAPPQSPHSLLRPICHRISHAANTIIALPPPMNATTSDADRSWLPARLRALALAHAC